jgi:hypothetical protein
MNEPNTARLLPLACLALALAAPQIVEAQFGGLGRRITEGAKKAAGVESDEAAKPGAPKPVVLPTDDPFVIPITDAVLNAFARGLQAEIDLLEQFRKELAAREAAVQKYDACKKEAAGSPETMALVMGLGNLPENATAEDLQKAMAQMAKDQEALLLKKCGSAPPAVNGAERLREIQRTAAANAGPIR